MNKPYTSTSGELEYSKLSSWELFERLCRDLLKKKYPNLLNHRIYLSRGHKQNGIDIRAFNPQSSKYIFVQCKQYQSFNYLNFNNAVVDFKKGDFYNDCEIFILAVSKATIDKKYEDILKQTEEEFNLDNKQFIIWDQRALDLYLKVYPQIVFDIFGGGWDKSIVKSFNGEIGLNELIQRPRPIIHNKPENYIPRKLWFTRKNSEEKIAQTLPEIIRNTTDDLLVKSYATIGKTTELSHLAYYYSGEVENVYFPILYSLKSYTGQGLVDLISHSFGHDWNKELPSNVIILLDGFDEIRVDDRDTFLRQLDHFKQYYPDIRLVISTRTNFVATSIFFDSFLECELLELTQNEIDDFLEKQLSNTQISQFKNDAETNKIQIWISSPYYLVHFLELIKEGTDPLPKSRIELINHIIEKANSYDNTRYLLEGSDKKQFAQTLGKLALSYNLFGTNSISENDLLDIFTSREVEIIKKSSLINFVQDAVYFNHNILQEYLAAKLISEKSYNEIIQVITFQPDYLQIKPKWFNTVSLLIDLLSDDSEKLNPIITLISAYEETILKNIEYSYLKPEVRLQIFKTIISKPDKIYTPFLNASDLAVLCGLNENEVILEELITRIPAEKDRHNLNYELRLLEVLEASFVEYYLDDIENVMHPLLVDKNHDSYTLHLCFRVLTHLRIINERVLKVALDFLKGNEYDNYLNEAVIAYLNIHPNFENFITLYLLQVEKFVTAETEASRGSKIMPSIPYSLVEGLSTFKKPQSLKDILAYLSEHKEIVFANHSPFIQKRFYEFSYFKEFTRNLVAAYSEDSSIYNHVLDFFKEIEPYGYEEECIELAEFFFKTNTNKKNFWEIWQDKTNSIGYRKDSVSYLIDNEILEKFKIDFVEEKINQESIWRIIRLLSYSKQQDLGVSFREQMNTVSGNIFAFEEYPTHKYDVALKYRNDIELLLDKQKYIQAFEDVFNKKEEITIKDIDCYFDSEINNSIAINSHIIYSALLSFFHERGRNNDEVINKNHVLNEIDLWENWEEYKIEHLISVDKEYHSNTSLETIQNWCDKTIPKIDFKRAREKQGIEEWWATQIELAFLNLEIIVPENIQLEMLAFDYSNVFISALTKTTGLTAKIISLNGYKNVENKLLKNLKEGELTSLVLRSHISWCKELNMTETLPYIKDYLEANINDEILNEFRTFVDLGGDIKKLGFLFKRFDYNSEQHWRILDKMVEGKAFKAKVSKLLSDFLENNSGHDYYQRACEILIGYGHLYSLEKFKEWYMNRSNLPDFEIIKHIENLNFSEYFPILNEILEYVFGKKLKYIHRFDPIVQIINRLTIHGYDSDYNFNKCLDSLSKLISKGSPFEENVYSLKNYKAAFEREYYLQKKEFVQFEEVQSTLNKLL